MRIAALDQPYDAQERDLLEACEATFNIEIEPDEAASLRTVGDLFDMIRWKCQSDSPGPSACSIAATYRLLRQGLLAQGVQACVRPSSNVETLLGPDPRRQWSLLRKRVGKALPPLALSEQQCIGAMAFMAMGLAAGVLGGLAISDLTGRPFYGVLAGLGALGVTLAGVMAYAHFFGRSMPSRIRTMADLARITAMAGHWRNDAPPTRPAALWQALEDIIRTDAAFQGEVTSDLVVERVRRIKAE